jgi:phage tail tape-measure protein
MSQNSDSKSDPKRMTLVADTDSTLHPIGIGLGAAGGGLAGAALGSVVGPVGTLVGGAIGVATGAIAGQSVVEAIDPAVEDAYWRGNYSTRDYVVRDTPYNDYQSAYQYGWESRAPDSVTDHSTRSSWISSAVGK